MRSDRTATTGFSNVALGVCLALLAGALPGIAAAAPEAPAIGHCRASPSHEAIAIPAPAAGQDFDDSVRRPLNAGETFTQPLAYGWQFALVPDTFGWSIRVYDRDQPDAGRVDLSAITPPFHGPANPRELAGWHFRNAANSGPNTGDVNAPQALRRFQFSAGLIGTGGLRPPADDSFTIDVDSPGQGQGWLRLLKYELADLEPGARARFAHIEFQACLSWPRPSADEVHNWQLRQETAQRAADAASPVFLDAEREAIGACGLDAGHYQLEARILPRKLTLDIDADGAADAVYQVRRRADQAPMLAICRAGTWLTLVGPEHPALLDRTGNVAHVLRALEAWHSVDREHGAFGYIDEPPWPAAQGDVIVLERIEKGMALLYWQDGAIRSSSVYRFVEP